MCVPAVIFVMILPSGFCDRMHCTSLQLVIADPMCPASSDSKVMFAHIGFSGRWPFGLSSLSVELDIGGFEHGHSFPEGVRAPISALYSAFWTWVSSRRRYLRGRQREDKDLDNHPYRGSKGRTKAGIIESTIPPSSINGLSKRYLKNKKSGPSVARGAGNVIPVSSRRRYGEDDCRGRCCNVWTAKCIGQ